MRQLFAALILIMITTLLSCGGDKGSDSDTTPPTVASTSPASGATNVPIASIITARFSENMNATTINTATITVDGGVTGTVTYADKTATFTPGNDMAYDSNYTVTISTGVKDVAGNALTQAHSWSFSTFSINTPPIITITNPGNGNVDVPVTARILATFSKDMDSTTINGTTFTIDHGVTGTVSYSNKTAVFTPSEYLAYDTLYTATVTTGVTDTLGNAMEQNYSWQFTAEPTTITDGAEFFPMADGDTWYYTNGSSEQITRVVVGDTTIRGVECKWVHENGVTAEAWRLSGDGFDLHLIRFQDILLRLEPPLTIPLDLVINESFFDESCAFEPEIDTICAVITEELRFTGYVTKDVPAGHFDDVIRLSYIEGGYFEYYARGVGLLDNEDYVLDSAFVDSVWYRP